MKSIFYVMREGRSVGQPPSQVAGPFTSYHDALARIRDAFDSEANLYTVFFIEERFVSADRPDM